MHGKLRMLRCGRLQLTLLGLVAASLLGGGGVGCKPELDGVKLRVRGLPTQGILIQRYLAFQGRREPGSASLALRYPLTPPFGITARIGVFDPAKGADTADAVGCVQLVRDDGAESVRLCFSYQPTGSTHVFSNADELTGACPDASDALLFLDDDGVTTVLKFLCPGAGGPLTTAPSLFDAGERWYASIAVRGLRARGELGLDDLRLRSAGPASPSPEQQVSARAFGSFLGTLNAFYELEFPGNPLLQRSHAARAWGDAQAALEPIHDGEASFSDRDAERLLRRAERRLSGVVGRFFDRGEASHLRAYRKVAADLAGALEAMEAQP